MRVVVAQSKTFEQQHASLPMTHELQYDKYRLTHE